MDAQRPMLNLGYHDSSREGPLSDLQYGYLLNQGVSMNVCLRTPITTNSGFSLLLEQHQ